MLPRLAGLLLLACLALPRLHAAPAPPSLATGRAHSCAITSDGTVVCWGDNAFGQLGTGATGGSRAVPAPVSGVGGSGTLGGIVALAATDDATCALTSDGAVVCWGTGPDGELGTGLTASAAPAPVAGVGGSGTLSGVTALSAGRFSVCARRVDGTVACWGRGHLGQLGQGTAATSETPVQVVASGGGTFAGVKAVGVGEAHACALKSDGTVWCWGNGDHGKLGVGPPPYIQSTPAQVVGLGGAGTLTGIQAIAVGGRHTCALTSVGTVRCWGNGVYGQLGNRTGTATQTVPVAVVDLDGAVDLRAGYRHTCARRVDATLACWGDSASGQLGVGSTGLSAEPVAVAIPTVVDVSAGLAHTCALDGAGAVWCWGAGASGQLGHDASPAAQSTPVAVARLIGVPPVRRGVIGGRDPVTIRHVACTLTGSGQTACWGDGVRALSDPCEDGIFYEGIVCGAVPEVPARPPTLDADLAGAHGLASSFAQTTACVLLHTGGVRCRGGNGDGLLGADVGSENATTATTVPVSGAYVGDGGPLVHVADLSVGEKHALATRADGSLVAWGTNVASSYGETYEGIGALGVGGTALFYAAPRAVQGLGRPVLRARAGIHFSCALLDDGTVACWGHGGYGQLGRGALGTDYARTTPGAVLGVGGTGTLTGVIDLNTGGEHACALRDDGTVVCWGQGGAGQLGNGDSQRSPVPVVVSGLTDAVALAGTTNAQCARRSTGAVACWGPGLELGHGGDVSPRTTPQAVQGVDGVGTLTDIVGIGRLERGFCALASDGRPACWGLNEAGQLGNGAFEHSAVPVAVRPVPATSSVELRGAATWRLVSMPRAGLPWTALLDSLWTQGVPGGDVDHGDPNAFVYHEATPGHADDGYVPADLTATAAPGTGLALYVFADDDYAGPAAPGFPKSLALPGGTSVTGAFAFPVAYTPTPDDAAGTDPAAYRAAHDGWNLLGNPYDAALDLTTPGWTRTRVNTSVYVYDAQLGNYRTHNGVTGTLAAGAVPVAHGFWVQATGPDPVLDAPAAARRSGLDGGPLLSSAPLDVASGDAAGELRLRLDVGDGAAARRSFAVAHLSPQGQRGPDALDALKLRPLGRAFALLGLGDADGASLRQLDVAHLPLGAEVSIPLHVSASGVAAGVTEGRLVVETSTLPAGYTATLVDAATGARTALTPGTPVAVALGSAPAVAAEAPARHASTGTAARTSATKPVGAAPQPLRFARAAGSGAGTAVEARYRLVVRPPATSTAGPDADAPLALALASPAPNPVRGVLRLRFAVPTGGDVAVEVFDALGRRVAVAHDAWTAAGWHIAEVDAATLAPGVYVARLTAGRQAHSRPFTVVR